MTADGDPGDGAPHEAENQRYRERVPVPASAARDLEAARADALRRLDALPAPRSTAAVAAALGELDGGTPWIAGDGAGGFVFEAQARQAGCLIGRVPAAGGAVVETGGFVRDGGCHALTGH